MPLFEAHYAQLAQKIEILQRGRSGDTHFTIPGTPGTDLSRSNSFIKAVTHVFSWKVTEHFKDTFEIHQYICTLKIRVSFWIHARYIKIQQDTYRIGTPPKSYRKPPQTPPLGPAWGAPRPPEGGAIFPALSNAIDLPRRKRVGDRRARRNPASRSLANLSQAGGDTSPAVLPSSPPWT